MTAAAPGVAAQTIKPPALPGYEIRSGIFRGFGTRHVILVVAFCIAYHVLGQLGWVDFTLPSFAKRMREFIGLPLNLTIGFGAILCAVAAENIATDDRHRVTRYALAALVASIAGTIVLLIWAKYFYNRNEREAAVILFLGDVRLHLLTLEFLRAAYISVLVVALHAVFEANRRAAAQLHDAQMATLTAEHELVEGDLRAMQARVDPELLFDSLRDVDAAYARGLAAGESRLDALIRFLRAALPGETTATSTVARELELARAYVALVTPQDFAYPPPELEAEPSTLGEAMPSMLLLPLVRWALAGGSAEHLRLRVARRDGHAKGGDGNQAGLPGACLEIRIENRVSGEPASGDGDVDSVRGRLEQLWADRALLQVRCEGDQRQAGLELPLRPAREFA